MSNGLTLRKLALVDMEAASNVFRTAFDARLPWLAGLHKPEEDRTFWSGYLFSNCAIWGAVLQGELIGVIAFREGWIDQDRKSVV